LSSRPSSTANKFSAAPEVPTYEPPEPTPTDPYPGYYQLPSGAWAAYDPAVYATFLKKWQDEYDAHVRALEQGTAKGFEGYDSSSVQDVDTQKEMERARVELKEREDRKALTMGAGAGPAAPNMKITVSQYHPLIVTSSRT
jgi:proline-rich protein PRCC